MGSFRKCGATAGHSPAAPNLLAGTRFVLCANFVLRKKAPGWSRLAIFLLLLANSVVSAQLVVENPKHLKIPEDQVRVLLRMSCQAVANELHLRNKLDFGLRLVLGEKDEHFGLDEKTGTPTLFLREWNAEKFTSAAMRFAVQRSIDSHRQEQIIVEVLRRSKQITPVSATELHGFVGSPKAQAIQDRNDCLSGIADDGVREVQCNTVGTNTYKTGK